MKVIAGLGNPGRKYEKTRHNVGFEALDILAEKIGVKWESGKKSFIGEARTSAEKVYLMKPQTYMNLSGEAIAPFMDYYNIPPEQLLVIYDDLDLQPGSVRLRLKGGHGGHNGLRSIIEQLGTKEFKRIRIGVGRPEPGRSVISHVLGTFPPEERKAVNEIIDISAQAAESWMTTPFDEVMNSFNRKA